MSKRIKLPPGWERCRTGIKGVRKWRNIGNQCWVTERDDDPDTLHCGIFGAPIKYPRTISAQQAIESIASGYSAAAKYISQL